MDLNDLRSFVTLFSFCIFLALAAWAWRPVRRAELDEAALLPFRGEAEFPTDGARHE